MHTHIYIYAYIHFTWLACKTDISWKVREHRSDVISWLFVVPRPHTHNFLTTHFITFILHPINETVTNRAALNWFRAPKRFSLWLSEIFCISQRMQESIDAKAQITCMGSIVHGSSGPGPRFFIVDQSFSTWYWPLYMASMQNWHFIRNEEASIWCHILTICGP